MWSWIIRYISIVIVIGGGNVATDSARAAIRMKAKSSTIVYRRDKEKMPARQTELDEAIEDGVQIMYNTKVWSTDIDENGNKKYAEGYWNGKIAQEEKGNNGFGYDPIFIPDGENVTSAEMTPEDKNSKSHRALALKKLEEIIG